MSDDEDNTTECPVCQGAGCDDDGKRCPNCEGFGYFENE